MSEQTGIEWTDHTFNPWWGCTRVSPGCLNCYAETWDRRWKGGHWGPQAPRRFFGEAHWNEPLKWNREAEKEGRRHRVFCASMADVFEDRRDLDGQRDLLWTLIRRTPCLDWQLLTKRPENILPMLPPKWGDGWSNVWLGTTVEDQERANERLPRLLQTPAAVRFLSCEPLLGPVDILAALEGRTLDGDLHWVIIGGESGAAAREFRMADGLWLIEQCRAASVRTFVKQLGARPVEYLVPLKLKSHKGGDASEWPTEFRVREFPEVRP